MGTSDIYVVFTIVIFFIIILRELITSALKKTILYLLYSFLLKSLLKSLM